MATSTRDADVVVVGAGLGGLVVAAYLAALGKHVIVVDRHSIPGGNATIFNHHGFEFDVGVHYLGDCEPGGTIPSVLTPLGVELTWREMDPDGFDTYVFPDEVFRVPKGVEAFRARLHERFPEEREGIDGYLDAIVGIEAAIREQGPPDPLVTHNDTTLGGLYDSLGLSPRLRTVLCGNNGVYALPPSRASLILHSLVAMHYLRGAFYPEGGGQVMADGLVQRIEAHGGEVILQTPVERIIVEGGRVRGVRLRPPSPLRRRGVPEEILAPVVVSNADLKRTYLELVGPEHLPADLVAQVSDYRMALPLFVHYMVIDRDLVAEAHPNSNVYVLPDDDVDGYYELLEEGRLPEMVPSFMTFTSIKDPTNSRLCRPGQTNLQAMTLLPRGHAFWGLDGGPGEGKRYRRNRAYLERKREVRDLLMRSSEIGVPGLPEAIVYEETATPLTQERFVRSTDGTSYGIECTPDQFLFRRPAPTTPIEGLFLAGASIMGAHGCAGVMGGGVMTASAIVGAPVRELVTGGVL
ncbi:MAG: NAD(P)/FAD-dependent oxidoreductase [Actinobacteria bacterium]|nr:NAD(P)/FAD-dependent oxidoreductase [Actinomycetota bacterium]